MNFEQFKKEIELSLKQNGVELELYSIIAHVIREVSYNEKVEISLRDVSGRRRTNKS